MFFCTNLSVSGCQVVSFSMLAFTRKARRGIQRVRNMSQKGLF